MSGLCAVPQHARPWSTHGYGRGIVRVCAETCLLRITQAVVVGIELTGVGVVGAVVAGISEPVVVGGGGQLVGVGLVAYVVLGGPVELSKPTLDEAGRVYEGGVRVPAFVVWPGRVPEAKIEQRVTVADVLPTLAEIRDLDAEGNVSLTPHGERGLRKAALEQVFEVKMIGGEYADKAAQVLEARDRVGGRIHTLKDPSAHGLEVGERQLDLEPGDPCELAEEVPGLFAHRVVVDIEVRCAVCECKWYGQKTAANQDVNEGISHG